MKRNHIYGLTTAIAIAACSVVQIQASQDMSGTAASAKNETVVTGCLVPGDDSGSTATAGATGTSGSTAGVTATADHFKLTDAIVSAASASGTSSGTDMSSSSAASTAAGTSGSETHPSFVLVGKESDLKQNVNSRVEVRGTIQANAFSTTPAAGTASSVTASALTQTLRVTSVKKISGSCTK